MKGLSAITVVALVAMTSAAVAAPKKASKASKAAKTTAQAPITSGATSAASSTVVVPPAAGAAAAAATTTGSLSDAAKAAAPRKVTGELYNEAYYRASDMKNEEGTVENWSYARVLYKIDDNHKVYVRQGFTTPLERNVARAGGNVDRNVFEGRTTIDDVELGLTRTNVATWAGGGNLTLQPRIYIPISADSNRINNLGTYHIRAMAAQPINKKLTLTYNPRATYMAQSQSGQIGTDGETWEQNAQLSLNNFALAEYQISEPIGAAVLFGTSDTFSHAVRAANLPAIHTTSSFLDMSVSAQVMSALSLGLGLENVVPLNGKSGENFALLRDKQTKYYMNLTASL